MPASPTKAECVVVGAEDIDALVAFARREKIDLVVVGPEGPLVKGLADRLEAGRHRRLRTQRESCRA